VEILEAKVMAKKPTVHYKKIATKNLYWWACLPYQLRNQLRIKKHGRYDVTLNKSRVTCGNCRRTKAFKEKK